MTSHLLRVDSCVVARAGTPPRRRARVAPDPSVRWLTRPRHLRHPVAVEVLAVGVRLSGVRARAVRLDLRLETVEGLARLPRTGQRRTIRTHGRSVVLGDRRVVAADLASLGEVAAQEAAD